MAWRDLAYSGELEIAFDEDFEACLSDLEPFPTILFLGESVDSRIELLRDQGKEVLLLAANEPINEELETFSSLALNVATAAYDYQRWTGASADQEVLQDAFEEYCSF